MARIPRIGKNAQRYHPRTSSVNQRHPNSDTNGSIHSPKHHTPLAHGIGHPQVARRAALDVSAAPLQRGGTAAGWGEEKGLKLGGDLVEVHLQAWRGSASPTGCGVFKPKVSFSG